MVYFESKAIVVKLAYGVNFHTYMESKPLRKILQMP